MRARGLLAAWIVVAACAAAGAQAPRPVTGAIHGRVEIRQPPPMAAPRPNVSALGLPPPPAGGSRRTAVVYLETAPRGAFEARENVRARMDQRNETFVPHVLAIVAGTTVDFPNNDVTYHNVFSFSKARPFDLGRYAAGRSRSVRFDQPGIVRVFCDIHSHMSAYILVFAHRFFAVTAEDGSYRIRGVPPGTYTLVAWSDSMPAEKRRVTVPDRGGNVEASFVLDRP